MARGFFVNMDLLTGKKTTLAKAKLVEKLAPVPYRAWERRERGPARRHQGDGELGNQADVIMRWGKEAQDNEHWHLLLIDEDPRRRRQAAVVPDPAAPGTDGRPLRHPHLGDGTDGHPPGVLLNGEFEDHAEHTYAQLVEDHPEWEDQPVVSSVVQGYGLSAPGRMSSGASGSMSATT